MIVFKCKMCGGDLNITEGSKIASCEYCGSEQTVPSVDDEKLANMFNRANYFRQNSEFDKALQIYDRILGEDSSDSETYWSIVLCRYGIEYVLDPVTKEKKPTINRTQPQSILKDADYLMALKLADYSQQSIYEREAQEIDRIQKGILQIAQNERPYDIFISYKEKAPNGERTRSSVLAQDIYEHLTREGYRVFFSRISLEDKLGEKYEPYIYSALTSAKVMLVIGTDKDEFMAPWVRNEWSRFLTMMREDPKKRLIPCFRDIDAYDLPEEFQILQSQDMGKIGFEQDLFRGIDKICNKRREGAKSERQGGYGDPTLDSILRRMFICLGDGDFGKATELAERVLDSDPCNATAYFGKLLIEGKLKKKEDLQYSSKPLEDSNNYRHVLEYGDADLVEYCKKCSQMVKERLGQIELKRLQHEKEERERLEEEQRKRQEEKQKRQEEERKRQEELKRQEEERQRQQTYNNCLKRKKDEETTLAAVQKEHADVKEQLKQCKTTIANIYDELKYFEKTDAFYRKHKDERGMLEKLEKKKNSKKKRIIFDIVAIVICGLLFLTEFIEFYFDYILIDALTDAIPSEAFWLAFPFLLFGIPVIYNFFTLPSTKKHIKLFKRVNELEEELRFNEETAKTLQNSDELLGNQENSIIKTIHDLEEKINAYSN